MVADGRGLFAKAIAEFEQMLAEEKAEQERDRRAALGQQQASSSIDSDGETHLDLEVVQTARKEERVNMATKKGTNQKGKRNALGRGLSALMTSNALEVQYADAEARPKAAASTAPFSALSKPHTATTNAADKEEAPESGNKEASSLPRALQAAEDLTAPHLQLLPEEQQETATEGLYQVPLSKLVANPNQPRQYFSETEISELAASIKSSGVLQPILVRLATEAVKKASKADAAYEIIAGERRFRAAKEAGLEQVPVLLRELDDREVLEVSIVENVQRSQLNAIEEAQAYARLQAEFGLSQEEVARTVAKDRATVANSLRLLKLSTAVQDLLVAGQLSAGHARALLSLDTKAAQEKAAQKIVDKLLSVRASEQLVRDMKQSQGGSRSRSKSSGTSTKSSSAGSIQRQSLEERFRRALGTKVQLRLNSKGAGELRINFFSEDELEKLLETLGA